jgi:hypothetical protein
MSMNKLEKKSYDKKFQSYKSRKFNLTNKREYSAFDFVVVTKLLEGLIHCYLV